MIVKDKVNLLFVLCPLLIGIILYVFLGRFILSEGLSYGNALISEYLSNETIGGVLSFIVATLLSILLFFFVNWTFVLLLSVIASPFNDMLSSRIEKTMRNEKPQDLKESLAQMFKRIGSVLFTEIKKVFFILILSLFAFVFGYIPVLTPVSVIISVLLLAISFLDYSWSRNELSFKECKKDLLKNILSYILGGGIFMAIVSIPFINIIVPPLATSYFTILWLKNNERRD